MTVTVLQFKLQIFIRYGLWVISSYAYIPIVRICLCDTDDNSSVSGSDSEGDDGGTNPASDLFAAATRHCKAFFTNRYGQVFCVYRCVLHHKKVCIKRKKICH